MALVIRMRQQGSSGAQRFRVVITDTRSPRDGKYIEKLGWYNPYGEDENKCQLDLPRIEHWLDQGAQISLPVKSLVKKHAPEIVQKMSSREVAKREKARLKRSAKREAIAKK
jgi:small subunit ribosomal protein S16